MSLDSNKQLLKPKKDDNKDDNRYNWAYWAERVLGDIEDLANDIKEIKKKNEKLTIDLVVLKTKMYLIVAGISIIITISSDFLIKWLIQ